MSADGADGQDGQGATAVAGDTTAVAGDTTAVAQNAKDDAEDARDDAQARIEDAKERAEDAKDDAEERAENAKEDAEERIQDAKEVAEDAKDAKDAKGQTSTEISPGATSDTQGNNGNSNNVIISGVNQDTSGSITASKAPQKQGDSVADTKAAPAPEQKSSKPDIATIEPLKKEDTGADKTPAPIPEQQSSESITAPSEAPKADDNINPSSAESPSQGLPTSDKVIGQKEALVSETSSATATSISIKTASSLVTDLPNRIPHMSHSTYFSLTPLSLQTSQRTKSTESSFTLTSSSFVAAPTSNVISTMVVTSSSQGPQSTVTASPVPVRSESLARTIIPAVVVPIVLLVLTGLVAIAIIRRRRRHRQQSDQLGQIDDGLKASPETGKAPFSTFAPPPSHSFNPKVGPTSSDGLCTLSPNQRTSVSDSASKKSKHELHGSSAESEIASPQKLVLNQVATRTPTAYSDGSGVTSGVIPICYSPVSPVSPISPMQETFNHRLDELVELPADPVEG